MYSYTVFEYHHPLSGHLPVGVGRGEQVPVDLVQVLGVLGVVLNLINKYYRYRVTR